MKVIIALTAVLALLVPAITAAPQPPANPSDDALCEVCELLIKALDSYLEDESSQLTQYLEDLCNQLPSSQQPACDAFVKNFEGPIVQWLIQELGPDNVCDGIFNLDCALPPDTPKPITPVNVTALAVPNDVVCDGCHEFFGVLKSFLTDPSDQSAIITAVQALCSGLGVLKSTCDFFVKQYTPEALSWLANQIDPTSICKSIGACTSDAVDTRPMLGAKECTWGPSYWCKDMQTATKCGAVEHCQKVWAEQKQDA